MKTPLYDEHVSLGARMVDFHGWEMPIEYSKIIDEHIAVRNSAGIFDVSHMGDIIISGLDANDFIDHVFPTDRWGNNKLPFLDFYEFYSIVFDYDRSMALQRYHTIFNNKLFCNRIELEGCKHAYIRGKINVSSIIEASSLINAV